MPPSVQLLPASSSLPLPTPLQEVQQSPKSYSSVLHNEWLTVCLFGLWMWGALCLRVKILCGLDDLGYEVGLERFKLESGVSDKAIDLANAPA